MKETRFPSMGLTLGFRVGVFETIAEGDKQAGRPGAMLDAANDAAVAWGAGAVARKAYVTQLEALTGVQRTFATLTNKDGTTRKSYSTSDKGESENKYGARVRALLCKGDSSVKPEAYKALKLTAGKANDEKAVDAALQTFADNLSVLGLTKEGTPALDEQTKKPVIGVFNVDLKEVERTKKAEALAQRYKDAATNIIKNGSQAKWVKTFTNESIPFSDFLAKPAATATAEEIAAVDASNLTNLAYAIKAREHKKNEEAEKKRQVEYQ